MKYFIGYLIAGDAAAWHVELAKKISEKFGTWKIYEDLPPHVTIVRPFEVGNVGNVQSFLQGWGTSRAFPGEMVLSGYDHFEDRVVFASVEAAPSVRQAAEELNKEVKRMLGIQEADFPIWHPHATLANYLTPQEFKPIWEYVQTCEKPNFTLSFDNVTLFRFVGERKWVIEETVRLKK